MGEGPNRTLVLCLLAVAAVVGGVTLGSMRRPMYSGAVATPGSLSTAAPPNVEVHVAGWVMSPGVVAVAEGAIVADAIDAAGGLRSGADAGSINLAAPVHDGDQIVVPGPDDGSSVVGSAGSSDGIISLNRATATELESLPGVGPVLAERIVAYREQVGGFHSVEDLLEVPGIGEAKLASLRDLVRP